MKRYPSCSFIAPIDLDNLSKAQQSILKQYKKLMYSHSTQFYEVETISYHQIPKSFPNSIKNGGYKYVIYLQKFTFYEMFTVLIAEYLFTNNLDNDHKSQKTSKINQLKGLVYSDWFMEGNYYMKGLLIKGFRILEQVQKKSQATPIAQQLLTTDIILSFTQCWKQLIGKICMENSLPIIHETQIDSSIFQMFASFFQINFDVHWKQKGKRFWKEHFSYSGATKDSTTLSIIVNPDNQISVSIRSIPITESAKSWITNSSISNWNYIILAKDCPPFKDPKSQNIDPKKVDKKINNCVLEQKQYTIKSSIARDFPKLNNDQISHISQVQYSCGETEQIKILLQENNENNDEIIQHTQKKTPKYMGQVTFSQTKNLWTSSKNSSQKLKEGGITDMNINYNQQLNNIWYNIDRGNQLIAEMREYTEFLQEIQY